MGSITLKGNADSESTKSDGHTRHHPENK